MTTVYNEIDKVGGDPLHRFVKAELVWDSRLSTVAMVTADKLMIGAPVVISSDAHGLWELELVPNADITPEGSIYRITHMETPTGGSSVSYFIEVTESPDRVWAGDLIVAKPEWLN